MKLHKITDLIFLGIPCPIIGLVWYFLTPVDAIEFIILVVCSVLMYIGILASEVVMLAFYIRD